LPQGVIRLKFQPFIPPFFTPNRTHGLLPAGLGQGNPDALGLHRALNEQAQPVAPLRRAGDFSPVPEHIELFMAGETLARRSRREKALTYF